MISFADRRLIKNSRLYYTEANYFEESFLSYHLEHRSNFNVIDNGNKMISIEILY
jgi:hypothetical protein